jgi:hypothetical protein
LWRVAIEVQQLLLILVGVSRHRRGSAKSCCGMRL